MWYSDKKVISFGLACLFSGGSLYISQASGIQIGNNNTMHFRSVDTSSLSSQSSTSSSVSVRYKELLEKYGELLSHTNIRHFFYIFILFYFIWIALLMKKQLYRKTNTELYTHDFSFSFLTVVGQIQFRQIYKYNQSINQDFRIILLIPAQKHLILLHLFFFHQYPFINVLFLKTSTQIGEIDSSSFNKLLAVTQTHTCTAFLLYESWTRVLHTWTEQGFGWMRDVTWRRHTAKNSSNLRKKRKLNEITSDGTICKSLLLLLLWLLLFCGKLFGLDLDLDSPNTDKLWLEKGEGKMCVIVKISS